MISIFFCYCRIHSDHCCCTYSFARLVVYYIHETLYFLCIVSKINKIFVNAIAAPSNPMQFSVIASSPVVDIASTSNSDVLPHFVLVI